MKKASYLLALSLAAASAKAFAGVGLLERQKQISDIQEFQDNFNLVRDRFYLGANGLTSLIGPWTQDSIAWMEDWQSIWNDVQNLPKARDFALARKAVEDRILDQNRKLARLKNRVEEFSMRSATVQKLLYSKGEPLYSNELFDHRVAKLVNNNKKLWEQIEELKQTLIVKSARLSAVDKAASQKLDAFVTAQSVLPNSPLKDRFAELKAALALGRLVDPYVEKMYKIREDVALDLHESRIFHAERRLAESQKTLERATKELELASGIPEQLKKGRLTMLTAIKNETSKNFTDLAGTPDRRYIKILEFANNTRELARILCSEGDREINCSLAEWLNRIPDAEVSKFSPQKLKALEFAWQAVQAGSSAESMADLKALQDGV